MKKRYLILILLLVFGLTINLANVSALDSITDSGSKNVNEKKTDDKSSGNSSNNKTNNNSSCGTDCGTCGSRSANCCVTQCGGKDADGNTCKYTGGACVVNQYKCDTKKHCKCYNAVNCPSVDDYGNACYAYSNSNTCVTKSEYDADHTKYDDNDYDNYEENGDVTCGNGLTFNKSVVNITYYMVLLFQIFGPVMLIVLGMMDLFKGVTSGKDDEIKKGQAKFFKRLFVAILMFLVITIVKIVINVFSDANIMDCFNCFVNGAKSC